jgi:electron-transferring-flavoprotein dehydrogenase
MMKTETNDIVVVGGGTAGAFAAATAAGEGLDVVLLERKPESEAGHIACGDAIKGTSTFPDVIDLEYLREESFTNENIERALFLNPKGENYDVPFDEGGAVVDRKRYGEVLLEEAARAGADIHYETVVKDVLQDDQVRGVEAVRRGTQVTYESEVVVDAAGALSLLQDRVDFEGTNYDRNVDYSQFCSAYREVIETPDPVEYDNSIVFKPTQELGYLWYFPRNEHEINAGLGFQMSEPPMELVEVLKRDLDSRPEFENAQVKDKLGAALPTRRPYDSAVAPGFMSVGDAAGHVNPTTGGGIPGAAKAGHWAGEVAVDAIGDGQPTEAALWAYNHRVQTDFGKRFAAMDLYNIFGSAHEIDELTDVVTALPGQAILNIMGKKGELSLSLPERIKTVATTAVKTRGHWDTLYEAYRTSKLASQIKSLYDDYPTSPAGFAAWRDERDALMEEVYEATGADPKY